MKTNTKLVHMVQKNGLHVVWLPVAVSRILWSSSRTIPKLLCFLAIFRFVLLRFSPLPFSRCSACSQNQHNLNSTVVPTHTFFEYNNYIVAFTLVLDNRHFFAPPTAKGGLSPSFGTDPAGFETG